MDPFSQNNLLQFIRQNSDLSRRKILDQILNGNVSVNGIIITDSSHMINPKDIIKLNNDIIKPSNFSYYKFNKPLGTISTLDDPKNRHTLRTHLNRHRLPKTLKPCGRLDQDSSGLLLFSNNGHFINKILHPSHHISKEYQIVLDRPLTPLHKQQLTTGIFLDDGPVSMIFKPSNSFTKFTISICIGRNRIIRRAFHNFGYTVIQLHRISIGCIQLGNLEFGLFEEIQYQDISQILK